MSVHLDIETRSRADLPEVGAACYGRDPSTKVLMAAVGTDDGEVLLWVHPDFDGIGGLQSDPRALDLLRNAEQVYAHNAPFEQAVLTGTNFQPAIPMSAWRCTAAMARIAGYPESLEKCALALNLTQQKDPKGKALIRFFSLPQEDGSFNDPHQHVEKWLTFAEYCRQDVRTERQIHARLKGMFSLHGLNLATFQFTLRMNEYGIPVNVPALHNTQRIIDEVTSTARERFRLLTGLNITQRARALDWFKAKGVPLENMQTDTLAEVPRDLLSPEVAEAMDLYAQLSFAAIKKIDTILDWVCDDGRVRGSFKFHGAGTGRWTASGPQFHNVKKVTPEMKPVAAQAYRYLCQGGTAEGLSAVYGDPLEVIASCTRNYVQAPMGMLLDADYNAIEARILHWLAGEEELLELWRANRDLYRRMASIVYGVPEDRIQKDSIERQIGKTVELGCGYGMGPVKFKMTCDNFGIPCTTDLAERAVAAYRESHPKVVRLWRKVQTALLAAVQGAGKQIITVGKNSTVEYFCSGEFLLARLPSGRLISYPRPKVREGEYGPEVAYWGQLPMSQTWGDVKLFGAKGVENVDQAIAADVMSYGARKAEAAGMVPFALIHDQALAEHRPGQTPEQFAAALASLPPWAAGLPLKAEAKLAPYYAK